MNEARKAQGYWGSMHKAERWGPLLTSSHFPIYDPHFVFTVNENRASWHRSHPPAPTPRPTPKTQKCSNFFGSTTCRSTSSLPPPPPPSCHRGLSGVVRSMLVPTTHDPPARLTMTAPVTHVDGDDTIAQLGLLWSRQARVPIRTSSGAQNRLVSSLPWLSFRALCPIITRRDGHN